MPHYNGKIQAEFNPPKTWNLTKVLTYDNDDINAASLEAVGIKIKNNKVSVPKGFKTDLASVPRACWFFLAPWDIARAAVIHDYLYSGIRKYRKKLHPTNINSGYSEDKGKIKAAKKAADKTFLLAMKNAEPPVSSFKIYAAYLAVVLFGNSSILPRDED